MNVMHRRWLVIAVVCTIGFGLLPIAAMSVKAYKANADVLIVSEALKDTTLAEPDLPSILTSTEVLGRVIRRLNLNMTTTALAQKIKTKLPPKSSVLELTYQDRDRVKAGIVTNAIADEATSYFHEIATRGYSDVLRALNRQIVESQAKMAAADKLLKKASANNLFASSDKALDDLTGHFDELRVERGRINASLAAD